MTAAVLRRDGETTTDLLCRLDGVGHRLAIPDETERALVQDERRVDQLAVIAEEPAGAVAAATFFIGGEGDDDVAVRNVAVLLHLHHDGGEDGDLRLVVDDAAAVEVAFLLEKLERVEPR